MAVQTQFSTDPNAIVTVNVSIVEAPTPITYQRMGAFVSFGGTTLTPGDTEILTQYADLNSPPASFPTSPPILLGTQAISAATWAAGTVTITSTSAIPNSPTVGDTILMSIQGMNPSGYNGQFTCTVTGPSSFTYPLVNNPGTAIAQGTYLFMSTIELSQMASTFFGQGNAVGVWVLELGYQPNSTQGYNNMVIALQNWLNNNPKTIYGFLLPRAFGSNAAVLGTASIPTPFTNLLKQYENSEAMEYFWLTVTPSTMGNLFFPGQVGSGGVQGTGSSFKDVIQVVEAPILTQTYSATTNPIPNLTTMNGEFTAAAMFYNALVYRASNTNRIAPMAFRYLYGVTQYPQKNNGPLLLSFKSNNTNYITTGAEGGISFTMVYQGVTLDGQDYFNWWYTIDWVQIQVNLDLSNAIINGSNNPLAPLYYNQDGINTLEAVLFTTMQDAQTFGMVLGKINMTQFDGPDLTNAIASGKFAGQCDVNAVPFLNYTLANPGDYKIGEYDGLSTLFIPARGFIHILVNVVASNLVSV